MCVSSKTVTEIDHILRHFEERFGPFRGRRIALYPGEYLEEILRNFDASYRFHRVLDPECAEVPGDVDLVILTGYRDRKEPDYNRIRRSCEERGVPLLDLFGLDQIRLHNELRQRQPSGIGRLKEILAEYDVISMSVGGTVANHIPLLGGWVIQRKFLSLYRWLVGQGKTVVFFWNRRSQIRMLQAEGIGVKGHLIRRAGKDRGFLRLTAKYAGKRIIHMGVGTVKDGIVPREYGVDSVVNRFINTGEVSAGGRDDWFRADRERLIAEIDRHDVISFDVFDTLLKRAVLHPGDVFVMTEERTGIRGFAERRRQVQAAFPHFCLDEIYECLEKRCGYDRRTAELLRRTELEVESAVVMPRRSAAELFEYAKRRNKTIVLVSDMYLDPGFIRELLEKNGITGFSALYVSCRYGKLKEEGLFGELLKSGTDGKRILHIGDNFDADVLAAQDAGLDAFYLPGCLELAMKNGYANAVRMCRTPADGKLLGLGIAMGFDDPFLRDLDVPIATLAVAPLAMGYLQWVCGKLADRGYEAFLLFARDGWILLDAYEKMRELFPGRLPEGRYFYANRHAAFLTVMDDPGFVKKYVRFPEYDEDPPGLLRRIFRLPPDRLLPWRGETAQAYCGLHERLIRETAELYRENYRKYLAAEGIGGTKCAAMDLVSEGSSQAMLEKHVTAAMDGYYVGIPEYASGRLSRLCYFLDCALMDYDTEMKIEVYFTSPEPALDCIGGDGKPVFAGETRAPAMLERIRKVQGYVREYLDTYLKLLYDPDDSADRTLILRLCASVDQYAADNRYYDDFYGKDIRTKTDREGPAAARIRPEG